MHTRVIRIIFFCKLMWASVRSNCPEAHIPSIPPILSSTSPLARRRAREGQLSSADQDEIAANQRDAPPCPYHSHPRWHARRGFKWGRDACELRPRGAPPSRPLSLSLLSHGGPNAAGRIAVTGVGSRPLRSCRPFDDSESGGDERGWVRVFTSTAPRSLYACVAYSIPAERVRDRELRYYNKRARNVDRLSRIVYHGAPLARRLLAWRLTIADDAREVDSLVTLANNFLCIRRDHISWRPVRCRRKVCSSREWLRVIINVPVYPQVYKELLFILISHGGHEGTWILVNVRTNQCI